MPEVNIVGPEGRLEGRYHHQPNADRSPIALILHPHPQFGGTMNNKVVYNLFHAFARKGFSALRFNFRGVGKSPGAFDNGPGELSDAASALDWLQTSNPNASACWVAGFSFGAWISMQLLMRRPEIDSFISVAPPANVLDFSFLAPCPASGLIVHGANDDIVPTEEVEKLAAKLQSQRGIEITYETIAGANHFFEEKLPDLDTQVERYLTTAVA